MIGALRSAGLLALACAAFSLSAPAGAAAQPGALAFTRCASRQVFVHAPGLQCATLDVPFDRAEAGVGEVGLAVQRVPASGPRAGTIVLLAGGPGQPALPAFESFLAPLAREHALRGFELVALDQRGTGQSQGLLCPPDTFESLFHGRGLASFFAACGTALGPTRAFYTSQESVEDLDALREALGGGPLSLFAVSYGTRVAGMYAREHPAGVARMVLDSAVPTTGSDPLDSERLRALRRMFDEGVCGAGACRAFSHDVYADLTRVLAKLHRHPLHTRIYDAHGRLRPALVTEAGVLELLLGLDLSPTTRELTPAALAAAARGDAAPLARLVGGLQPGRTGGVLPAAEAPLGDSADSFALYAATYCVENQLPWSAASPVHERAALLRRWLASLPAGSTSPFLPATVADVGSALRLCEAWPATPPAPPSPTGVSATPTLVLSGYDDLRTPYEQALTIAAGYEDVRLLRVPDVGHSTVTTDRTGCAKRAMIEFLTAARAPASCPGSSEPQALALPPSSLAGVRPATSHSRLAGRVAAAAAITLEDLFGQTSIEGGGLRGGSWSLRLFGGYVLHGMRDVPGVTLSGSIHVSLTHRSPALVGRLSVDGRLDGVLTLHERTLSGRIGGARVRARLATW